MKRQNLNEIMDLITKRLKSEGFDFRCIEAEWNQHDRVLRIYIDRTIESDNPSVVIDDCVEVTKILNKLNQLDDMIRGAYNLEVSSPGVERPLRLIEDFDKHSGSGLVVRLKEPVDGQRSLEGIIKSTDQSQSLVSVFLEDDKIFSFGLDNLLKAHLRYNWSD